MVALVSPADKATIVWYVKALHTRIIYTEAYPGAPHAYDFIPRPNNPNNAMSATVAQYAGPQTNRLTVTVAVKAAKAASPSTGSLFARCRRSQPLRLLS